MKKVLTSLEDAAKLVKDADLVTTGGATFHRAPMEFVRELVRQNKKNLCLVDREPALDFDLLIGAGCVAKVRAGMLAFEVFGMAPNFRKKSEVPGSGNGSALHPSKGDAWIRPFGYK
jgi:glutaconate CoA-transferase subunit A